MLAAAIVNNDSFSVFVVYGRVANPCKYVLSMMLASNAGLQAIYRAHLFTMSLLPSNLQVRLIVNKWARFSVGGSL